MTRTENVELLDVVLQPHYMPMDIDLTVTYNEVNCACSSDTGETTSTEKWTEYELADMVINRITCYADEAFDTVKAVNIEEGTLLTSDIQKIWDKVPPYEP
tara:strand:+ start:283 stop:585 length:303 start_codon:yes stop_codon:yes gene_type:complete